MRTRIVILLALTAVCASTLGVLAYADHRLEQRYRSAAPAGMSELVAPPLEQLGTVDDESFDPVSMTTDLPRWERENAFLMKQNAFRQGWGPLITEQSGRRAQPDAVKVVVAGDSYVWGQGAEDLDALWPHQLERELNRYVEAGYQVTRLGRLPSSFMQVADWLDESRLRVLQPDVIVVGYLRNDFFPTLEERDLCRSNGTCTVDGEAPVVWNPRNGRLVQCIQGDDSLLGAAIRRLINPPFPYLGRWLTNRYCDPDRVANNQPNDSEGIWVNYPAESPYWTVFTDAVRRLSANAAGIPVVVYDYDSTLQDPRWAGQKAVREAFEAAGFEVISPSRPNTFRGDVAEDVLGINPSDRHPGPRLSRAFAQDLAEYIHERLAPGQSAVPGGTGAGRSLLSNYLPATLVVEHDERQAIVRARPLPEDFVLRNDLLPDLRGERLPLQEVPCARMGRPHVRLMLDPYLPDGTPVKVTLTGASDAMVVQTIGYDAEGSELRGEAVLVQPGGSLLVRSSEYVRGLLIGTRRAGCPDGVVTSPQLDLTLERLAG